MSTAFSVFGMDTPFVYSADFPPMCIVSQDVYNDASQHAHYRMSKTQQQTVSRNFMATLKQFIKQGKGVESTQGQGNTPTGESDGMCYDRLTRFGHTFGEASMQILRKQHASDAIAKDIGK